MARLTNGIFISYAREDREAARAIRTVLQHFNCQVWMDETSLVPGQQWDVMIRGAIRESVGAIFLASRHSLPPTGYLLEELEALVAKAETMPAERPFLVVLRIDPTALSDPRLHKYHWLNVGTDPQQDQEWPRMLVETLFSMKQEAARADADPVVDSPAKEYQPASGTTGVLFTDDECDIYCNKSTNETFIFHGKVINYDEIRQLEYIRPIDRVIVVYEDGRRLDLGVQIMWLIKPYFVQASQVHIVRTVNKKSVEGVVKPLFIKGETLKERWKRRRLAKFEEERRSLLMSAWSRVNALIRRRNS